MTENQRGSLAEPTPTGTRLSELISWRLLKKNPSGALVWGIFGATLVMDAYFFTHFLRYKEYQVDHKKRMWNERIEMLENPVKTKLYYTCNEAMPEPASQPLIDVYKRMREEEERRIEAKNKQIEECLRKIEEHKNK